MIWMLIILMVLLTLSCSESVRKNSREKICEKVFNAFENHHLPEEVVEWWEEEGFEEFERFGKDCLPERLRGYHVRWETISQNNEDDLIGESYIDVACVIQGRYEPPRCDQHRKKKKKRGRRQRPPHRGGPAL